ncbi:TPA: amino acid permease [Candidatus Woesearchaeota archaeon]|nr:amino acid permease [Candidatus Woesearchaeota archaeon]
MTNLKRDINLFEATIFTLGVIIGAGIYVLVGKAAGFSGNGVWLSFLLASLIAACTGLSYAELSSTYPYDSAEYLYTWKAFKDRKFSFGIGWLKLAGLTIGMGAVALGFGGYLNRLLGLHPILGGLLLIAVLMVLNLTGIKSTMMIDIGFVLLTIAGLVVIIFVGAKHIGSVDAFDLEFGWGGVMTGAALIFFAFLGFENIGNIGEETKDPRKTLPRSLIISIVVSTLLYTLVALVAVNVVPWKQLAASSAPLADVMHAMLGSNGALFIIIIALAATASTVLGLFVASSRLLFGMAEEGSMPKALMRISKRSGAPFIAIIASAVIGIIFVIPGDITTVASLTDWAALFVFLIVNLTCIWLRFKDPNAIRGFRIPGSIARVPVIPVIGIIFCGVMMFHFSKKLWLAGIVFFLVGLVLYSMFWEKRHKPLEHHERTVHHMKHYVAHKPQSHKKR